MTTLYVTCGIVAVVIAIVGIALRISRKRGEASIAGEITAEALEKLEDFQEHTAEPVPTGDDAIDRLP